MAESVPGTLLLGVADSAGGSGRAGSPALKLSSGRWRPFTGFRPDARLLIAAALLALVLPAVATWALGSVYRTSETDRVDARLSASLRVAAERVAAVDGAAGRSARTLAESLAVQRALAEGNGAALARFASRQGVVSLTVRMAGQEPPAAPPGTVLRTVSVVGPAGALGSVDAAENLSALLSDLSERTRTSLFVSKGGTVQFGPLRAVRLGGPAGRAYDLRAGERTYRAAHVLLTTGTGIGVLAVVPRDEIDGFVHRRQLLTLGASFLTVAALALAILLLVPGGRTAVRSLAGRRGERSPLALFGEVVAAAHDPRALLPVILETTVSATGAAGGQLIWDGEPVAETGADPRPADRLVLSLDDEVDDRRLVLYSPRRGFTAADRELARSLAGHGRIALDNARLHSVVRRQAVTDELTDLANRRRFMDALRQEVARSGRLETPLALVLFDLDHFKQINDRSGHQKGDDVLRAASDVIRERVRETDLAARIGGEEFAVILPGTGLAGAVALAEHLRRDLSRGVVVPGVDQMLTASFGVAEHRPGELAETLIGIADRALYRAKAEGRDRVNAAPVEPRAN
jgi:diguanylate cyclase (GGDEF)-like protein